MNKIVLVLTILLSTHAFAMPEVQFNPTSGEYEHVSQDPEQPLSLDDAIRALQNDIKLLSVSRAITCAENNQECLGGKFAPGAFGPVEIGYEMDIQVLRRALLATERFSSSDLARINKAIKTLEER